MITRKHAIYRRIGSDSAFMQSADQPMDPKNGIPVTTLRHSLVKDGDLCDTKEVLLVDVEKLFTMTPTAVVFDGETKHYNMWDLRDDRFAGIFLQNKSKK